MLVVWTEGSPGGILALGQKAGAAFNSWGSAVDASTAPDTDCDWPTVAKGCSTVVCYQKQMSPTNTDIVCRINFNPSNTINVSNTSNSSTYGHVVFELHHDSFPVLQAIWTEVLSQNYAEMGYKRWQLGLSGGGGAQSASVFNPAISPRLFPAAPNPFTGRTCIKYQVSMSGRTRITVFDVTGRTVRTLVDGMQKPGVYSTSWDARDGRSRTLARGVYFVRLQSPNYSESKKVVLAR